MPTTGKKSPFELRIVISLCTTFLRVLNINVEILVNIIAIRVVYWDWRWSLVSQTYSHRGDVITVIWSCHITGRISKAESYICSQIDESSRNHVNESVIIIFNVLKTRNLARQWATPSVPKQWTSSEHEYQLHPSVHIIICRIWIRI